MAEKNPRAILEKFGKPIPEFPGYEASNQGRIRSVDRRIQCINRLGKLEWRFYRGQILSPGFSSSGYPHVQLGKGGYDYSGEDVHALVMRAFVGPCPEDHEIGHRDGNPANANLTNLRYVTYAQNYEDQVLHGRAHRGERHYAAKLTEEAVREIRKSKQSNGKLAKQYGVSPTTIFGIRSGKSWGWLK